MSSKPLDWHPRFGSKSQCGCSNVRCLHAQKSLSGKKIYLGIPENGFHLIFILLFSLWTCVLSIWKGPSGRRSHIAKSHSARCLPSHRRWRMPHQKSTLRASVGEMPRDLGPLRGVPMVWRIHASNHIYIYSYKHIYIYIGVYTLILYINIYL